ncbi:hypothetical protein ACHAQJ_008639 [Trichoderma viride]
MSSSSTCVVYNGRNASNVPNVASVNIQAVGQVPADLSYSMNCFLKDGGKTSAGNHLRPPVGFGQAQSQAESEARIKAQLLAFGEAFDQNGGPGGESSRANK